MKRLAYLLLLLTLCTPAYAGAALELGAPAPDVTLSDLDGKAFRLSDLRGRIILLKLATTWCPSCQQQTQELTAASRELTQRNVAVVEIFLQDSAEMVRAYLRENPSPYAAAVLLDDDRVRRDYNVYLIPRTILIDREFRVRRDGHLLTRQELEGLLQRIDNDPRR